MNTIEQFNIFLDLIEKIFNHLKKIDKNYSQKTYDDAKKTYIEYYLNTNGGIHPELALHIVMPPTNKPFKEYENKEPDIVFRLPSSIMDSKQ